MKRIITLVSAVALTMGLFSGVAAAEADPELVALEQAYEEAEAEVARLEGVVADIEDELAEAREDLRLATEARDAKAAEVQDLEDALDVAREDLKDARLAQAAIEGLLAGLGNTYKDGDCNNRDGKKAACDEYLRELASAVTNVAARSNAVEGAEQELESAGAELEILERAVTTAAGEVERLDGELQTAQQELSDAELVRDIAKQDLEDYVPSVPTADAHSGCKGIKNAQQQVAKNGAKGKAAEALATVAEKFDCVA